MSKVAVVLSGCGVYDGSEINEAMSALIHLSRAGAKVQAFAPDTKQSEVIDHTSGNELEVERNIMVESARIVRGKIAPLSQLEAGDFDAVVFPGGFGAAKNLSDFAKKGAGCDVLPDVERVLKAFRESNKVIGLSCIAPVLAAKVFGESATLTVGSDDTEDSAWPYAGTAGAIEQMGSKHVVTTCLKEACVDTDNKIVTCAAYMYDGKPHEIYDNMGVLIEKVIALI